LRRNSYLYLNISAENGSNAAEANRENVIGKLLDEILIDLNTHFDK